MSRASVLQIQLAKVKLFDWIIHWRVFEEAFFLNAGFCGKDTGGPLVDAQGNCIGIASWSTGCARGLPDIYAKLWTAIPFYRQASGGTIPGLPQGP